MIIRSIPCAFLQYGIMVLWRYCIMVLWRHIGVVTVRCCSTTKRMFLNKKEFLTLSTDYINLLCYTLHTLVGDFNATTYDGHILVDIEWQVNHALTVDSIMYCKFMGWFFIVFFLVVGLCCWRKIPKRLLVDLNLST